MNDPILEQTQPHVNALNALTPPMETTKQLKYTYFKCSVPNASIHRKDGKRLGFIHGYFKTDIKQDVDFLRAEIESGGVPYIEECSGDEISAAEASFDPAGTQEKRLREKIMAELSAAGMLNSDTPFDMNAVIIAGVDQSAAEVQRAVNIRVGSTGEVTPVGSDKINAAAAGSAGTGMGQVIG